MTILVNVQNDILLAMDRQEITLLVVLDLSSALDTVNHMILVDLLQRDLGVVKLVVTWFKSYLSWRKQSVVIHQQQSRDLANGVPQGRSWANTFYYLHLLRLLNVMRKHPAWLH